MKTILALLLSVSPAFACGDGSCEPPKSPPPSLSPPGDTPPSPYVRQFFAVCTCDEMRVAWGFETFEVRKQAAIHQCEVLRIKRQCPAAQE